MKKYILEFCLLSSVLLFGLLSQIQTVRAISKTYTWYPPPGDHEGFEIFVEAEDSWQTALPTTLLIRATLVAKHWSFDHVDIKWTKVELSTLKFSMDSGTIAETSTLKNIGDHYERRTDFEIPSDKLNRGENVSLSLIWSINIDIVDNVQWKHWIYTGNNSDNPLNTSLYRPLLSTVELIIIVAVVVIVVGSISGFLIYRRRRIPVKAPSPPTQ